jgi:quercetin dioxygenase-like cupin family protein
MTDQTPHHDEHGSWEQVNELVRRQVSQGSNMTVSRYQFEPGGEFPLHRHEQEQVTVVLSGDVTMTIENEAHLLGPGESIIIAPNVLHRGSVGSHGAEVVGIVAPPRSDSKEINFVDPPK